MGIFGFWKKQRAPITAPQRQPNLLESLCEGDLGLYEALRSLRLNLSGVPSYDVLIARAREKESSERPDTGEILIIYETAGFRALYDGDVGRVREAFEKVAQAKPRYRPLAENPDKAVAVAQAYYENPSIKDSMKPPVRE